MGEQLTGKKLDEHASEAKGNSHQGSFLIADALQHLSGRNAHKQISQEVHHVAKHSQCVGAFECRLVFPDDTDRSGEIRDKGDHSEEEDHGHDGDRTPFLIVFLHFSNLCF